MRLAWTGNDPTLHLSPENRRPCLPPSSGRQTEQAGPERRVAADDSRRRELRRRRGRDRGDRRRVGFGQDHAARTARRPRSSDLRRRCRSAIPRSSDLSEDGLAALRQRWLGFVFQSFQLLPALTALENVMLPLELAGSLDAAPSARASGSRASALRRASRIIRSSSPAASSSASRSRALSPASRRS